MKAFTRLAVSVVVVGSMMVAGGNVARAGTMGRYCSDYKVTRLMGPGVVDKKMTGLIKCVFSHVGIPGQIPEALYVADRESGLWPWAINHALYTEHDCLGLFQHMRQYWRGRAIADLPLRQFPHRGKVSAYNARANAWVTAVMVKHGGWGPWTTAS